MSVEENAKKIPTDAEAEGALAQMRNAAAPDVTTDNSYHEQLAQLNEYAQSAINEVLAQYRFLGLLAGIKGPNDDDDDVKAARDALMEALGDFLAAGPLAQQVESGWEAVRQKRDALQERIFEGFRNKNADSDGLLSAQGLLDEIVESHPDNISETRHEQIASGAYREYFQEQLSRVPADLRDDFNNIIAQQEQLSHLQDVRLGEKRAAIVKFFSDLWNGIKDYYNENMALIRNGQWLLATGRVAIDVVIFAAEEVVVAGIVTAIIGLTGGTAAVVALGLRAAVRMAVKAVRLGSRTVRNVNATWKFRIELTKVQPGVLYSNPSPLSISIERRVAYDKVIDVEKDLTPDERLMMGEGGQGSTRPDVDAHEPGGGNSSAQAKEPESDQNGQPSTRPRKDIDCFDVPRNVDRVEFDRQLQEQQDTINNMTADDLAYAHTVLDQARLTWREQGGKGSFTNLLRDNGKAQEAARARYIEDLKNAGLSKSEISKIMSGLDATHYLDIIAGGDPSNVGMGGSAENQRIGPAWTYTNTPSGIGRAESLRREAEAMRAAGLSDQKMNVGLSSCN